MSKYEISLYYIQENWLKYDNLQHIQKHPDFAR